ncbi:uncharacterized protein PRCAT00000243001 [Priceomyces carsonii]|uniref:uncharacterized protein n=1 Tax=Priceomyces carsonii TaxID=28549 RepID=UPI002ED9BF77|nr:unnamed protein product [Priceomyces carsonii]
MYHLAIKVAIFLSICLMILLAPVWPRKGRIKKVRSTLGVSVLAFILLGFTPEKAVNGAPFHLYKAKTAFFSCNLVSRASEFCGNEIYDVACSCKNFNAMATVSQCYLVGYKDDIESFLEICKNDFNISVTRDIFHKAHDYYINFSQPMDLTESERLAFTDRPLKLEDSNILLFKEAYDQFLGNYDRSVYYGAILVLYWIFVFTIASISNWTVNLFPKVTRTLNGSVTNWYRRHISLPATGHAKTKEKPFLYFLDMLVPSRQETLIIAIFLLLVFVLGSMKIHYVEGDPIFDTKERALLRYVAVRSGILASFLLPLLILFAGRNNFLQWITQWNYATYITLHRWISRIVVGLVVIHSICYSYCIPAPRWKRKEPYLIWGIIATFTGIVILIQGLLVLRRKWYELFLFVHIALAAVFIIGSWLHVENLYCLWFYYVAAAVWALDRCIRLARIFLFGFPNADVFLLADDTLKVIVPTPLEWEGIPGGHVFIHFLGPTCFWQSHPFTYTTADDNRKLVLYVKVKEGITSTLRQHLKTFPGKATQIRVAIEGSYGEKSPAGRYDKAVFIAGGNGIPGIYEEAVGLSKKVDLSNKTIDLIWVVKDYNSLYWFYEELLSLRGLGIETTIYVTRPDSIILADDFGLRFGQKSSQLIEQKANAMTPLMNQKPQNHISVNKSQAFSCGQVVSTTISELSHIKIINGRPDINNLIRQGIMESKGSSCFIACGHPSMVDDIRAAVVSNVGIAKGKRIDYFEQLQVWA